MEALACFNLGSRFADGRGVPIEMHRAAEFFESSCNLAYAEGCVKAAEIYSQGNGVVKDEKEAAELYRLACFRGSQQACSRTPQSNVTQQNSMMQSSPPILPNALQSRPSLIPAKPKVPLAAPVVADPVRQAELERVAQSIDKSLIWTGYPNCDVILSALAVTPTPASLEAIDNIPCGQSLEILRKDNKFYLVRTRRDILGYVVANAVSLTH
jgi:TPR repeat protein